MLDVSVSYNRYKFLGYEYLTWLWFVLETDQDKITNLEQGPVSMEIGNRIVLENKKKDAVETITIKGDDAGLEEGLLALGKGAFVTEINLVFTFEERKWRFSLKGESLAFSSLRTPDVGAVETGDDVEGVVLEKAYLYEQVIRFTEKLFRNFIELRVSMDWNKKVVPRIKKWILPG